MHLRDGDGDGEREPVRKGSGWFGRKEGTGATNPVCPVDSGSADTRWNKLFGGKKNR